MNERTARARNGDIVYVLNPPEVRRWGTYGDLLGAEHTDWRLVDDGPNARLRSDEESSEAELLELSGPAATALEQDDPEPLITTPAFEPFGGVADLGKYYLAGRIVTGVGHKRRVDSTALSLYRIARWRGGPLWSGVADIIAAAMAERVESFSGPVPHDLLDLGETHVRYLNDALLLMVAHAEWRGENRWARAASRIVDSLEIYTVPYGGGRWLLHDSLEHDAGRNDLVLNTHVQGIIALSAAGVDTSAHRLALHHALEYRAGGAKAFRAVARITFLELLRAFAPQRLAGRMGGPYPYASRICQEQQALRLPGGWIARDLSGKPAPGYYATVNLLDLGGYLANSGDELVRAPLKRAIRFALTSGFFAQQTRVNSPLAPLIPASLRVAGQNRWAAAFARRQIAGGGAPMIGWPGYTDHLWSNLAAGTP